MNMSIRILLLATLFIGVIALLIPEIADAGPGGRGGGGAKRSGSASSGSVNRPGSSSRSNRSSNRSNNSANRADNRGNNQSNRQDNRGEAQDNRNDNRREVQENRQDNRSEVHEYREDRWRRHRARHVTAAAFRGLSCRSTVIVAGGVSYHSCGGTYYERVYQGGTTVYVVVSAPPGY